MPLQFPALLPKGAEEQVTLGFEQGRQAVAEP